MIENQMLAVCGSLKEISSLTKVNVKDTFSLHQSTTVSSSNFRFFGKTGEFHYFLCRRYNGGMEIIMIEIKDLMKTYGSKPALEGISFHIGKGEIVGFLGPNGAGKSTTMNIMTGYLSATSGSAVIGGIDVFEYPDEAKKLIGFLPEQPPLYFDMKVGEYLNFVYELKKCKLPRKPHLEEIMKVTKIIDVKDRLIANLSKGYRQRIGIAQALIGNPPVIILDEPTVGLDPKQIIEIRNLIRNLKREHTVILSSHILSEVQAVCERIIIINEGRIIADELTENIRQATGDGCDYNVKICGPQREVLSALKSVSGVAYAGSVGEREGDVYSYLIKSERGVDIRKPLFYMLAEHQWPLMGLEAAGMELEDVFVKITENDAKKHGRRMA